MEEPTVYFAHAGGEQLGPLTREELDALARSGRLQPSDLVWESGSPEWVPAATLVFFGPPPEPAAPAAEAPAAPAAAGAPASFLPPPPAPAPPSVGDRLRGVLHDISTFSFSELVPLGRLVDPEALGTPASWVLLVFGLAPLLVGTVVEDPLLRVRLFNFGCGALWAAFFVVAFKTGRQSLRLGIAVFFASGIFGVLFVSVLPAVPPVSWLHSLLGPERPFAVRLLAATGGVALPEELGKGLILLLLARRLGGLSGPSDGVFYGLMSGLGFGVWEAMMYAEWVNPRQATALTFEAGSISLGLYSYFVGSVVRVASLPLLHAVWTAIVGYFVGVSFAAPRKTAAVLSVGIGIAVALHGPYEAFLSQRMPLAAFALATLSVVLFLAYRRNAERGVAAGGSAGR